MKMGDSGLDLNSFNKALKLSWVRKYLNDNNSGKWKLLFDFQLEDYGGVEFFRGNLDRKDVSKYINVPDPFIAEIVQIWTDLSFEDTVKSMEHLLSLNLWHNSLVKVGKKPIYYKSWSAKGIQNVRHLMRDESKFLSFTEFKERFDIKTNFLTFYGVIFTIQYPVPLFSLCTKPLIAVLKDAKQLSEENGGGPFC